MKKKSLELKGIKFGHISGVTVITLVLWDSLLISLSECALRIRHQMKIAAQLRSGLSLSESVPNRSPIVDFFCFELGGIVVFGPWLAALLS